MVKFFKNGLSMRGFAPVLAAAALSVPIMGATAAPAAAGATSNWVCAYTAGNTGKACFLGSKAQVCDLSSDGRRVYGSFSVSGVGVTSFRDGNGAKSGCSYQTYSGSIGSVSAYTT